MPNAKATLNSCSAFGLNLLRIVFAADSTAVLPALIFRAHQALLFTWIGTEFKFKIVEVRQSSSLTTEYLRWLCATGVRRKHKPRSIIFRLWTG